MKLGIKTFSFLILATACLSSCAGLEYNFEPNKSTMDNANYGKKVSVAVATPLVEKHFTDILKDPDSAKIKKVGGPIKGWLRDALGGCGGFCSVYHFGYIFTYAVNAKNSYGGYTGYQDYVFLLKDNKIAFANAAPAEGNYLIVWGKKK